MEFYLVLHGIAAVVLIVVSFGHIYMGTAALEGTFEVMQTGYCDSNWAKDHHDLWYDKVKHGVEPAQQNSAQANTGHAVAFPWSALTASLRTGWAYAAQTPKPAVQLRPQSRRGLPGNDLPASHARIARTLSWRIDTVDLSNSESFSLIRRL